MFTVDVSEYAVMCTKIKRKIDLLSTSLNRNIETEVVEVSGEVVIIAEGETLSAYKVTDSLVELLNID